MDIDGGERKHGAVPTPHLVAIEFTVADLTPCLELFGGVLGLEMTPVHRHPTIDAEVVQVNANGMVINLLCSTDTGNGSPLANPEPRLSQLNFVLPVSDDVAKLRKRCEEAGAAVVERDESLFYIDSHMSSGMLGPEATLVFSTEEAPEAGPHG